MSDLQSKVTWPWDMDEAGCQEPSHNLRGKPACDEGSQEGQWNYRQSRILSDKHMRYPDLSTLLYELRRFLIFKSHLESCFCSEWQKAL